MKPVIGGIKTRLKFIKFGQEGCLKLRPFDWQERISGQGKEIQNLKNIIEIGINRFYKIIFGILGLNIIDIIKG